MKAVDLIVYDLDGTLVNTLSDITNAVNFALHNLHLPLRSESEVKGFIGEGVRQLVERSLGREYQNHFDQAFGMVKKHYAEHLFDHSVLYPGVLENLEYFKNKKQAVLTNKPERFSIQILEHLGIRKYFSYVIGGDSLPEKKPSPVGLRKIMNELSVDSEKTVLIGDSAIDIATARNTGVSICAFLIGFTGERELKSANPDFAISHFSELKNLFS